MTLDIPIYTTDVYHTKSPEVVCVAILVGIIREPREMIMIYLPL